MKKTGLIIVGFLFTLQGIAQENVNEKSEIAVENCQCKTVYYSQSGYGKLQAKTRIKTTTKKGCLNQHKTIIKFSGRTEQQIPTTYFCGNLLKKG